MPTKRQHYVPRTYLKAWEMKVENSKQPGKLFDGIYVFEDGSDKGEGLTRNKVLWSPHLYTVSFLDKEVIGKCSLIRKGFVNEIARLMDGEFKKKVYAKYKYSVIKTTRSINKHLFEIEDWDFYYEDGGVAGKKRILERISTMNSYLLEDAFSRQFEECWEELLNRFIDEVHNGKTYKYGESEKYIDSNIAEDVIGFFFMMMCRNPSFDAMGIYTAIKERIIKPVFDVYESEKDVISEEIMRKIWCNELYRLFYSQSKGFYNEIVKKSIGELQMILFETYDGAGEFITSDNPAFEHISWVESNNLNGFFFPLTPKYLLFACRGSDGINVVDHRFVNGETIRSFNAIIMQHSQRIIVGTDRHLNNLV